MNKTQPTPEEITAVVSEQPDLYQPTVQPLDAVQDNGYFPIEVDAEDKELAAPSLAKLATPSSDRNWLQRFKVAAKTAVSNIMNAQMTHNVALGNKKITFGKNKEEIEFGRRMASEAKRQIEEVMDGTEELTAEEAESWAAALGGGSVSMVEFAANLALLRGLGAGSVGAQLGAGWLAGRAGYEEGTMSDIDKYIAETGDKELKNYKGDKKAFAVNVVSGAIQGSIEAATSGLGRYLINNPLAKKVLGKTGRDAIRKLAATAVGRALGAGANEAVNNAWEEGIQALTGNVAEIVKGNEEFSMDNILNGSGQAAGVGALLGWVATPVMQEYGRRKTRDWISDKLRKASEEKGIPLTETEIKDTANDLLGRIESKGVQKVSDNYDKIIQLTDSESDMAQTLSRVFEDLVNQGQIKFRQATPDEIRQAGLDWANWQQALALMDSLEREIPLSAHPLFNAVAEADRIFLEGRDPATGDLLPLDINNAQVRELANQIEDYIEQNRETRQAEEASKLVALREADMRARQETIQELERAAIAELEKEQVEKNQERITELQQQITELQHQMDLLREERSQYVKERAAQGRISIGRAKAQTAPDNKALTKKAIRSGNLDIITQILQDNGFKTRDLSETQIKQMAQLNWEKFAGRDLGMAKSKYDQSVAMKAIEQNVVSGDAVLLRAGYTQGQIDQMDDKTWNRALQAAYREEAEALESVQPQLTPEQAAQIPDDLQYQDTPFDLAAENARLDEANPEYTGETIEINGVERTVYNSNGDRIAKSEPALRNFWAWFGDSKVVDEGGRPLVVYHGTNAKFDTFDTKTYGGAFGFGAYFSDSYAASESYGENVFETYLKIENPLIINNENIRYADDSYAKANGYDGIINDDYINGFRAVEYVAFEPNQIKSTDNKGTFSEDTGNIYHQDQVVKKVGEDRTNADDLQYQDTPFDLAAENARLDDIYPEYTGETINIDGKERTVYNSNGERIAKSEPALRNFWNWFGNSKVVDEQGRPLVVYHSTKADFDTFKILYHKTDEGLSGEGFYFTPSKEYSKRYGDKTLSLYLSVQNMLEIQPTTYEEYTEITKGNFKPSDKNKDLAETLVAKYRDTLNDAQKQLLDWNMQDNMYDSAISRVLFGNKDAKRILKEQGYDGVKYIGKKYNLTEYTVYNNTQIKSVNNRGTFSEDTGNIYYQTAYAGSRVDYDRPSLEAIGSGEGNQAHGWGLYYALDPQIAESYRETFMSDAYDTNWKIDGVPLKEFLGDLYNSETFDYFNNVFNKVQAPTAYEARSNLMTALYDVSRMYSNNYTQGRKSLFSDKVVKNENDLELSHLAEEKRQFVATLRPDDITVDKGQVHEVDIPEMDVFLDEQKTFDEQSEFVKSALDSIDIKNYPNFANAILNGKTGKDIYNSLIIDIDAINEKNDVANANPDKQASQLLEQYGIKGITYDGRQDGRCFVIFNPKDIKVLRKKFDEFGRVLFQNKKTSKSTTGLGTEHRGGYDPITKAIIFNKTSDLTTLFHESAHYWFDRNLRYYRTGLASPEWKKKWEDVMNELGATPNARGTIPVATIRSASEKFARSMEAYLREGKYESAAIQWAHQDYANMVKRVYRNIWATYWGLDDLSPAVKQWFDMFGLKTDDATTAFAEEDQIETDEQMVGAVIAEDATKPDVDAETKTIVADAGAQVVENPATQEIAVVPADPFETGKKARSKLPRSAEAATGVSMDDIIYNRRSMSDAFKAAQQLVNTDPVRAWEILKGGQEMVDGLYAGDIYRALIAKYQAENNPTMLKNVVQAFAGAARRAGRSVKAFDLESPRISFEKTINSLDKIFDTKKNDKRIEKVKNELKEFLHDPSALRVGWEEFKNIVGCK